jgi:transporter family protein
MLFLLTPAMKLESTVEAHQTRLLTLLVIGSNVVGNVLLSHGMRQVGKIVSASPLDYVRAFANPWAVLGVLAMIFWLIGDLALLSRADLSFVLPITASSYVLIAIAGHFLLSEQISSIHWAGIVVITLGVVLAGETRARTTNGARETLL